MIVLVSDKSQAENARRVLAGAGAESLDAARKEWWVGLRDAEELEYGDTGGDLDGMT